MTEKREHPCFDDGGTLDWYTDWSEATGAARREGKLVFVELGRELCGQCRSLVQAVIPRPDVASLLQRGFVALAADADDPQPEVHDLIYELKNPTMLPFVILTDAEGRFLAGSAGAVDPAELVRMLEQAAR